MHAEKRGIGKWYPCIFLTVSRSWPSY